MHGNRTVSLDHPRLQRRGDDRRGVVEEFRQLPSAIDEIVVVDNNCKDRTAEIRARNAGARVVSESASRATARR